MQVCHVQLINPVPALGHRFAECHRRLQDAYPKLISCWCGCRSIVSASQSTETQTAAGWNNGGSGSD